MFDGKVSDLVIFHVSYIRSMYYRLFLVCCIHTGDMPRRLWSVCCNVVFMLQVLASMLIRAMIFPWWFAVTNGDFSCSLSFCSLQTHQVTCCDDFGCLLQMLCSCCKCFLCCCKRCLSMLRMREYFYQWFIANNGDLLHRKDFFAT